MADHCSKMERRAMKAEWAVRDLHVALFMKDKVGEEYEGVISSVTKFGFFVELYTYFVEGLVPLNTLTDDTYQFVENRHELLGDRQKKVFRIGSTVRVRLVRVDIEKRRLDFQLA
jgi:ribonuclease R